jgi:hypothetical protein
MKVPGPVLVRLLSQSKCERVQQKLFSFFCAAAIHLQSFNNTHPLLRWDVK